MKKYVIMLFAFISTLNVSAEDNVPAILFFHNDSIIQSFLRSEVDSLGYSYIDINGEERNEVATQLVYLQDTIIQIPLAEIDSVVYTPPSYSYWVLTRSVRKVGHYKAMLCGTLGGKIAPDAVVKETGFIISCYSKGDKIKKEKKVGASFGDFESEIDFIELGLGCERIYYFRAYAIVNGIMYIGTERTISLSPIYLVSAGEDVQKEPTEDEVCSATVFGELLLGDEKEIEEAGFPIAFLISKKDNPKEDDDDVMKIEGSFNENNLIEGKLEGLKPGTKYYYRPYIETCEIIYGGTGSFVTPPQIFVTTVDSITKTKATTAELFFSTDIKMVENQLHFLAPVGIQIERDPNVPTESSKHYETDFWLAPKLHEDFSAEVNGLLPETKYNYRAYTEFKGKIIYGETKSFTTNKLVVNTYDAIIPPETPTMAYISGELMEVEAMRVGEHYGFYYDTQPNVDINSRKLEWKFTNLDTSPKFGETLVDLDPEITYYYRAFVTYQGKPYFGVIKKIGNFVVKTYDATDVTSNSAHITGEVINNDIDLEGCYYGLIYYSIPQQVGHSYSFYDKITKESGMKFSWDIKGLTPETTYEYQVFVMYEGEMYYGDVKQFTTEMEKLDVVTDTAYVTSRTAHLEGKVMNKPVMIKGEEYGFYYSTDNNLNSNSLCVKGVFTNNDNPKFDCDLTSLVPGTTYYYQAYVIYKGNNYYGEVKQFTMDVEENILIKTNDPEMVTSTTAFLSGEILSTSVNLNGETCGFFYKRKEGDDDATFCQYELNGDKYYGYLKNLIPNTTYYYKAYVAYKDQYYLGETMEFTTNSAEEEQGYAEYDSETGTLTFRYGIMPERYGFYDIYSAGWSIRKKMKKVVFEPSFAKAYPYDTSGWFYDQRELKEIVGLQYLNTSHVINMSYMFYGCSCIKNLDLSSFNTSRVTNMSGMFRECDSLESINLSSFDTGNVTSMSYMFQLCYKLNAIDISSFNMSKVQRIDFMFGLCPLLKTIYVGTGWRLESILSSLFEGNPGSGKGRDIFSGCSSLVGGAGTEYHGLSSNDYKLAHVDGGPSNPGVLTAK